MEAVALLPGQSLVTFRSSSARYDERACSSSRRRRRRRTSQLFSRRRQPLSPTEPVSARSPPLYSYSASSALAPKQLERGNSRDGVSRLSASSFPPSLLLCRARQSSSAAERNSESRRELRCLSPSSSLSLSLAAASSSSSSSFFIIRFELLLRFTAARRSFLLFRILTCRRLTLRAPIS